VAALARRVEAEGWDGLMLADSQNLVGDPYVELALAARETARIRLGTGVTNPLTRHPAVTAAAIATVHAESGGRAVLGIARGDSALTQIGLRAASVADFEAYLTRVRGFLAGETVDLEGTPSRIDWLPRLGLPPVPVDAAASGPRTLAAAARRADRVTLTVGADEGRIRAGIAAARRARAAAGADPASLRIGAFLNVVAHPDARTALELARPNASIFAHFLARVADGAEAVSAEDRAELDRLRRRYEEAAHGRTRGSNAAVVSDAFVARFAVAGRPAEVAARLRGIAALGLDHIVVSGVARDVDPRTAAQVERAMAEEVLPAMG
jgi:5,10-methylenetetrahydromethanopterin reductase